MVALLERLSRTLMYVAFAVAVLLTAYTYYESVGEQLAWRKATLEAEMTRCKVKR